MAMPAPGDGASAATQAWHAEVCLAKSRYKTKSQAKGDAPRVARLTGVAMRAYHCPICKGYHLRKLRHRERV
jgi:hypothetical protein